MNIQLKYKEFTLKLLGYTVVSLTIISTLNLLIDPFGIYNIFNVPGFNKVKPDIYKKARMSKAHSLYRLNPDTVIAGTSRSEWGINVKNELLKRDSVKIYNLSLPGASIIEIFKYIKFANRNGGVKRVILGLDFFSFNALYKDKPDFSDERLNSKWNLLHESFTVMLSVDTLLSALQTLYGQNYSGQLQFDRDGQINDDSIRANYKRLTPYDHLWSGVLTFMKTYFPDANANFNFKRDELDTIKTFKELILYCRNQRISLYLFISPVHAVRLETINALGLWNKYEYWKRSLVRILESEKKQSPSIKTILYDFSGYNQFSTEDLPSPDNKSREMNYFWNDDHYKSEIGDIILEILLVENKENKSTSADFGIILNENTIERHLRETRVKHEKYGANHASISAQINDLKALLNSKRAF